MSKGHVVFVALVALLAVACGPSYNIKESKPTPQQILKPVIDLINSCSRDTSINTMAYKASFDTVGTKLVVFLGKSVESYEYKWEIPLKLIDKTNLVLFRQDYNVSSITMSTYGSQNGVKYYMDRRFKSNSPQFVLYLGKCFSSEEKEQVLQKLVEAITVSQIDQK